MSASKELKTVHETVKTMMQNDARLRDNDRALFARFCVNALGGKEFAQNMSVWDFFVRYAMDTDGDAFPSSETISRARRKIEQEFPELRGKNYKERHNEQENVKQIIREL